MDPELEQRIRELAYGLWQSAERPYWMALEYWLMAEKMVLEVIIATSDSAMRMQTAQMTDATPDDRADGEGPSSD
jgi:hypothetical protein